MAKKTFKKHSKESKSALENQKTIFKHILSNGHGSKFTQDFGITRGSTYDHFVRRVPLMVYEDFKKYIDLISFGKKNVLTKGRPSYFAITSGTTSGTKYIPLTREMMNMQTKATKELLLLYAYQRGYYNISGAGMMFVQGTPKLNYFNKVPYGKLSGIAAHHVPFYLKKNRFPSMKTNCIQPWDKKIKMIVKETLNKDLRILGGIPPWVMTYFKEVLSETGANKIKEVFPNLQLYIHGGTSFQSYQKSFFDLCGQVDTLEVYPASEGFFAYQDSIEDKSLTLLTNHGVFYEFVRLGDFNKSSNPDRISLEGVELNVDYVMVVSTIAGLWSYNTGDTIRFVSKNPYKIMFSGRASQFCSAFGEHVIEKEVQVALNEALRVCGGGVLEFTVAPRVSSKNSRHDWFIEFSSAPKNLGVFKELLCKEMGKQNLYYRDLVESGVIETIGLYVVKNGGFAAYMKSIGKFGGQNKCPHLSNNRNVADFLIKNHVKK
ncbi:GH3 auxin-responsive promoter family protein [Flavobacteriales bacterium]|nr:GH3 auxin-responsive promoter family protein [Flavobacteriales bacterium]